MSFNNANYLKNIGAFKVTFNKLILKDAAKGKPAIYAEFKTTDGRIVSQRFNRPIGQFDHGKVAALVSALGRPTTKETVAKATEGQLAGLCSKLEGKELVVLVSVSEFNGKEFFQVKEVLDPKYSMYIDGGIEDGPSPFDDDFGDPVASALYAFGGATLAAEDEIPF